MKNRKLLLIVSLILAMTMAMGGTLAYLTDTDEAVNVMTLGNVDIEQYEKDAEGNPFVQSQPLYPAYLDGTDVIGEIEKVVTVENTGSSDAYVRTWVAFEAGNVTELTKFQELIKAEFGFDEKDIHWQDQPVQIEDQKYFVAYVVYPEAVKPGEETAESLKSVYMAPTAGNADVAQFGDTYEILVLSEAVQTKNMETIGAEKALEAAFGIDHPWQEGLNGDVTPQLPTKVVKTAAELREALQAGGTTVVLANDIELDADETIKIDETARLDLAGYTITAESNGTGSNRNLFDVNGGTLTVNDGIIKYEHTGANMGWNNSTNIFNVTADGVLNLNGVTARNLGGSDMAFVVHLNNWGDATLNANNSDLESTYCAVRAFNSGPDMNNVSIYNSTLVGPSKAFWVHNYTAADFGDKYDAEAVEARLNIDIENGTNVIAGDIEYGFTNEITKPGNAAAVKTAEALESALAEGGIIALADDVTVTKTLTVPAGKDVDLILNGDLSYAVSNSGASAIINNKGNLTLSGEGTLSFVAENPDLGTIPAYATNTITNTGTLTIEAGVTVENGSEGGASYAVDNHGIFYLNGGTLKGDRCALRVAKYNADNVVFVMNDGLVTAKTPAWIQLPGSSASAVPNISVTINGGTMQSTKETSADNDVCYTYSYGNSHANTSVTINGGEFLGGTFSIGSGYKGDAPTLTINGGTFEYDVLQWLENDGVKVLYEANK